MGKPRKLKRIASVGAIGSDSTHVESNHLSITAADCPNLALENCLKAALQLRLEGGVKRTGPGQLAAAMKTSPSNVSRLLKTLSEYGFAVYEPYAGIILTVKGRHAAARILRRHRLIETFLARVLKLSWDQVHVEAERIEHTVSDLVTDRLDDFLNYPCTDPHGDPIPSADGTMRGDSKETSPLGNLEPGTCFLLVRVINQQLDFLRNLSSVGVGIGCDAVIELRQTAVGTVTIRFDAKQIVLSQAAASQLLVQVAKS